MKTFEEILNELDPHDTQTDMLLKAMKIAHDQAVDLCLENARTPWDDFTQMDIDKESILKVKDMLK